MKAKELMAELIACAVQPVEDTVDTIKAGDENKEVKKVATCFIATPEVIKAAHAWGADLLITHEPTYYDHHDYKGDVPENFVISAKKALLDGTGMAVYRFHDHMHAARPDQIIQGEVEALGWDCAYDGGFNVQMAQQRTAREVAKDIHDKWGVSVVRMTGDLDTPMTGVYLLIGAYGDHNHMRVLQNDDCEILVVGETCEWRVAEYVRDATQLGFHKALLICGHVGSERDGMKYLAQLIAKAHPELGVQYFECGEVWSV